jgi:hypothetical protein
MNNTNTGEPAFPALPITRKSNGELLYQSAGLTMRDYFAAKAMAICPLLSAADKAEWAYKMADAMLKAREA